MPFAWSLVAVAATVVLGLAVGRGSTAFDAAIAGRLGGPSPLVDALTLLTHPALMVFAMGLIAALTARTRPLLAVLAVAGPILAVSLNTWVLKPGFDRVYDDHLAYPSGHTTTLAAVLTVAVIAWPRVLAVAVPLVLVAGAAIVAAGYHYATDIVGATLWGPAAVTFLWGTLTRTQAATPIPRKTS
ncbi:phosphatase PAP2 family protein [Actinokineospora soli]